MIELLIFVIGLFFGSFFGVLVDRIPRGETIIGGRSYCESCKKKLAWYDLIPVLSFFITKGRCRYCRRKLPLFYPIIEVSTGTLFVLTFIFVISNFKFQISNEFLSSNSLIINPLSLINLIYYLFMVSLFIVIFFTDLRYGIIPDMILLWLLAVNLLYLLIFNKESLMINLFSGMGGLLFFVLISLIFYLLTKKVGFGGGDLKLAFVIGLFLGFPNVVIALYLAFLTGAFCSLILIIWGKKSFSVDTIPFGPFLVLGTLISLFWGNIITANILHFLGA